MRCVADDVILMRYVCAQTLAGDAARLMEAAQLAKKRGPKSGAD